MMQYKAEETDTPVSSVAIGGRPLCNLRFANDINLLGNSVEDLQQLTQSREETAAEYGMEISFNKSKILVNSIKPRRANQHIDERTNAPHKSKTEHQ